MGLTIHLLCNDGSPMGIVPPDIETRGVGGAELAMMTLMRTLAQRGHAVTVFNDPKQPGEYDGVHYAPLTAYDNRSPRDVIIVFRSPHRLFVPRHMPAGVRKIWWSTDQYTVGDFRAVAHMVDFAVTISPHHTAHHQARYGISLAKMGHIDLGVRLAEYQALEVERKPRSAIFCSIPDRGLTVLHQAWPLILREVPDASLTITSDYRLWGTDARNQQHRLSWAAVDGVEFLGKIPRSELIRRQAQAQVMAYPCTYEELFCISAAECQVAGALPVTSKAGALETTNEWGIIIPGDPHSPDFIRRFAERIVALFTREAAYLEDRRPTMMAGATLRFDWDRIAETWERLFEEGKL